MKELADRRGTGAALMRRHGAAELDWLEHSAAVTQGDESRRMAKPNPQVVKALARCVLAGECSAESIAGRLAEVLGRQRRWIAPFAARYIKAFGGKTRPRNREVVAFFLADRRFCRVYDRDLVAMMSVSRFTPAAEMQPIAAAKGWGIPAIRNVGGLAEWLGISLADLEWFADLGQYEFRQDEASKLHHYDYQFRLKALGAYRLIEAPKPRLKDLQRQVLTWMLDRVPPHPAAHGFVRGRSIQTFAEPHVGQAVVLRIDLKEFFPSIRAARVQALFRTMGYPEPVADLLGGICTASVPRYALREMRQALPLAEFQELKTTYRRRHLPQGGPTSPSLANLCAVQDGLPVGWAGGGRGSEIYALCGRSCVLRGRRICTECGAVWTSSRSDRDGRRIRGESPQNSSHAQGRAAGSRRAGGQREGQRGSALRRRVEGDSAQLRPVWAGEPGARLSRIVS
ncbi:hypothetical protein HDF16_002578 [Granulicella aggregans]|uniref:RNA-directed DNA polymerase n=1 Tax=Granulicella aggregans TaxID=474949 RepID=A0A7W8E3S2_9BACT|nr:reverse transcriptase family protein [Granulicella aggregans]MBB5057872.1 hypothetical protein [Granulicella aggregans]